MENSKIFASIALGFVLISTNPIFAGAPWENSGLQCLVDTLDTSDKLRYLNAEREETHLNPSDCVVGHWALDPASYEENLWRMTENLNARFDEVNAVAEIIIDPEGVSYGCIDVSVHSTVESRGLEASVVITMKGPTISLIGYRVEFAEEFESILEDSPHFVNSLSEGVSYKSVVTVEGRSYPKDIEPMLPLFGVDAAILCAGNSMTITTFPPGVDFVKTKYNRLD